MNPKQIKFVSFTEMMMDIKERKIMKHELEPKDNPYLLTIGCLDLTNNEWLTIRIGDYHRSVKTELTESQLEIVRRCMATAQGKEILFGNKPNIKDLQELASPIKPTIEILADMGLLEDK
jgi:hypothetical protein